MGDYDKCVAGCKHFTGGEVHHHKDCPHYPESMSRVYDEMESKIKELEKPKRQPLADGTLELTNEELEEFRIMIHVSFLISVIKNGLYVWVNAKDSETYKLYQITINSYKAILYLADRFDLTEVK